MILQLYGKGDDLELVDVVRRAQWPDIRKGASLDKLAAILEDHGVHTRAIRLSPDAALMWSRPVLLHLNPVREGPGHYVVWLPSSTKSEAHVWEGLAGINTMSTGALARQMSGFALLTSENPIGTTTSVADRRSGVLAMKLSRAMFIASVAAAALYFWNRRGGAASKVSNSTRREFPVDTGVGLC